MSLSRIYADFQNLDDDNRLRLTCVGTLEDLQRQGVELTEGLRLTFRTDDADDEGRPDDLLVDGIVHYHEEQRCWVAEVDWHHLRHASRERAERS
jgi:hypothetical protein